MSEDKTIGIVHLISILILHYLSQMKTLGWLKRNLIEQRLNFGKRPWLKKWNVWIRMRHGT